MRMFISTILYDCNVGRLSPISILLLFCIFLLSVGSFTVHEQELYGEVDEGNYSYYHLKTDFADQRTKGGVAAVVLILFSVDGDADLYVSRSTDKPTYIHGEHDFQSTTCGIDRLDINLNAPAYSAGGKKRTISKSKLSVGVYGHPSYPVSRYSLKVFLLVDDDTLSNGYSDDIDGYMAEEMRALAALDQWREWVQHIQTTDTDFSSEMAVLPDSGARTDDGHSLGEWLKAIAEILVAIISFVLNILVEIMI